MKLPAKDRALSAVMITAMAAVLVILAALQYRWSKNVSEATEGRLREGLRSSMLGWHFDVLRALDEIGFALQLPADETSTDSAQQHLRRYIDWRRRTTNFDLVRDVFLWQTAEREPQLVRLNWATERLEPCAIPPNLNGLLQRLRSRSSSIARARQAWELDDGSDEHPNPPGISGRAPDWQFDQNVPALVQPLSTASPPATQASPETRAPVNWLLVELNFEALQAQIFPELSRRYFGGEDGLDYRVALVREEEPRQVVYASEPEFGKVEENVDARLNVFGAQADSPLGLPQGGPLYFPNARAGLSTRSQSWREILAPRWFRVIQYRAPQAAWELIAQHRMGSLEAVVAETRYRDLGISFAVLALLGVSMGMVILTSQRAQRLAQLQMDFVTSVSHELRTPLAVICSAAENLADGVVNDKQQLTRYGSVLKDQTRQLTQLVEQILLYASNQESKPSYHRNQLTVVELIDSALHNTAGLIEQSDFIVEREIESSLPALSGDLTALSQCLQNLIVNAVKYSGKSRWIRIQAHTNGAGTKQEVQISVQDRGAGIEQSELSQIFEPFYRSPSATAAQIHGTGLGLALARSIAEAMGGKLTVVSSPGEGSLFTLHLPFSDQDVAAGHQT
jgi:signal transduction histidine kinase